MMLHTILEPGSKSSGVQTHQCARVGLCHKIVAFHSLLWISLNLPQTNGFHTCLALSRPRFAAYGLEVTTPPPPHKTFFCHPCQYLQQQDCIRIAQDIELPLAKTELYPSDAKHFCKIEMCPLQSFIWTRLYSLIYFDGISTDILKMADGCCSGVAT